MHFCITSFNYNLQFTTHRARSACDSIKKCRRPFPIALAKTVGAHKKMSAPLLQCMSKSPLLHCMSKSPLLQLTMHVEIHLQKCMSKSHWYNACRNPPAKMHVEIPLATMHVEIPLLQCMSKSLFCTSTYLCSAQVCTCAAHKYILPAFFCTSTYLRSEQIRTCAAHKNILPAVFFAQMHTVSCFFAHVHTCALPKYVLVLRTSTYCQLFLFFAQVHTCAVHKYVWNKILEDHRRVIACTRCSNPRRPRKGNSMHTIPLKMEERRLLIIIITHGTKS